MENKRRNRLNFLQNISIVLLSLSAVVLFAQTQFYNLGRDLSEGFSFLDPSSVGVSTPITQTFTLAAPLRVTVSDTYGRYGNLSITTDDEEFAPLDNLLKLSLGSAKPYVSCSGADYLNAFSSTSVYYDFLSPLPLSVVASFSGISVESSQPVRTIIVSDLGTAEITLYFWDGNTGYYQADTAATRNDLTETISRYELGSADLALDLASENETYSKIHPCSLFLRTQPELPELSASIPANMTDRLLLALDFNPNTKYRSVEASGAELIVENNRSLRVQPNGAVHYLSGDSSALVIDTEDSTPTLQQAALYGNAFLADLTAPFIGEAKLYLQDISQTDDITVLRFGYHINGIPLRFANGAYAAEMTLIGSTVTALDLHIRQYTAVGPNTILLPLQQALAIAAKQEDVELSIGYADKGTSVITAAWLAD